MEKMKKMGSLLKDFLAKTPTPGLTVQARSVLLRAEFFSFSSSHLPNREAQASSVPNPY